MDIQGYLHVSFILVDDVIGIQLINQGLRKISKVNSNVVIDHVLAGDMTRGEE